MEQKVLGHHESEWCLYGICSEDEGKVVFHTRDKMFHYLPSHCKETRSFYLNNVRDVFESKGTKLGWFKDLFYADFKNVNLVDRIFWHINPHWFKVRFLSNGLDSKLTPWYVVHELSMIEENRYWVADDESKYTADFLFRHMNASEFAEYMKDRGIKTIK